MRSIHNYINYKHNYNNKYSTIQLKYSRVSYSALYRKLDVKTRIGKWQQVFKGNVGYRLNDSQYWFGNP